MKVLIVLGSPNSDNGELGATALDRLNSCLKIFNPKEYCILCTGGFGAHFNSTSNPHASYAMNYLMNKGVSEKSFLEFALSANTVEDAVFSKKILENHNLLSAVVITSDYHLERVKLIFDEILALFAIEYIGVKHDISDFEREKLIEHEKKAINGILNKGLYY
ncbi:YdcF family protein [uncultured Flavobacterium sp.]|uniref:YdcF family protein n=1 Tax=uncultured Flavobacterium sp. TaxID=165435 RepID=UPI0025D6C8B9|nr:YdcF family protein [uncultured Flavobacterium sp.]